MVSSTAALALKQLAALIIMDCWLYYCSQLLQNLSNFALFTALFAFRFFLPARERETTSIQSCAGAWFRQRIAPPWTTNFPGRSVNASLGQTPNWTLQFRPVLLVVSWSRSCASASWSLAVTKGTTFTLQGNCASVWSMERRCPLVAAGSHPLRNLAVGHTSLDGSYYTGL